ncbi:MAG: HEAT repeat domain-containing protein [Gemmatimonadaceae bacterium]|nr:HEAT repeat domain-containing protein [Gemmatimonadaceae bacterium]
MSPTPTPLDDEALQRFLRDGYITLDAGLDADFHRDVYEEVDRLFEAESNPGNNILPRVPGIRRVLDSPPVHGALKSLLGVDYYLHAHRFCHYRQAGSEAQQLHKDSWSRRHHRTRWCMAFYYPQDTTEEMGPTGIVPGSQYLNGPPDPDGEVALAGRAGTVTIVHYDLWHRGLANTSDRKRYMLKFLFTRLDEPAADGRGPAVFDEEDPRAPLWRSMWRWQTGHAGPAGSRVSSGEVTELAADLGAEDETRAQHAAYRLGESADTAAVGALLEGLRSGAGGVRRNAAYGLTAVGAAAVPGLVECLAHGDAGLRAAAVDALGDLGRQAAEAAPSVSASLEDEDLEVRRQAAHALGTMGADSAVPRLAEACSEEDDWVARNASLSLARLGAPAEEALPALGRALDHDNRYVRANALRCLQRIDSSGAREMLYHHLATSRWCPITASGTPY